MGNLNQFYFMGRVAKTAELREDEAEGKIAHLAIAPGTGGRRGRGLTFVAYGPQAEMSQSLRVGQAVILRGQLRQEGEGAGALVARVQAIQVLAEEQPRASGGGDGEAGAGRSTKRRRRRGGRGRKPAEGEGAAADSGEAPAGADAPPSEGGEPTPPPPPRPEPKPLPPPTPIAKPADPAPPAGDVKADMPF